ncbi:hypothetical protein ACNKH9_01010 [Metapseudomonas otitidis]|uniref:hypothetical protein n=1 Tax=Metapseudomonas otitidis TaxID=319939 RepID=UPI003A87A06C
MKRVLNIGSGFLPMVSGDFSVACDVINYDPLDSALNTLGGLLVGKFSGAIHGNGDNMKYYTQPNFYRSIAPATIDLVIGVSPFGFSLIDENIHNSLKIGASVLIAGNKSNPYLDKRLFAQEELRGKYLQRFSADDWILNMRDKIRDYYPSHTSALERGTPLDRFYIYQKESI